MSHQLSVRANELYYCTRNKVRKGRRQMHTERASASCDRPSQGSSEPPAPQHVHDAMRARPQTGDERATRQMRSRLSLSHPLHTFADTSFALIGSASSVTLTSSSLIRSSRLVGVVFAVGAAIPELTSATTTTTKTRGRENSIFVVLSRSLGKIQRRRRRTDAHTHTHTHKARGQ